MREPDCPYPGLRPFGETDAHLFFGRDSHTDRLLEILAAQRFLAVIGPSGSGKSSLVRAGLLPTLPLGAIGTGSSWRKAVMRPGNRPLTQLALALLQPSALGSELCGQSREHAEGEINISDLASAESELRRGPLGLVDLVTNARQIAQGRGERAEDFNLLVLVDQFEELFTYAGAISSAEDESEAFVNLLLKSREESSTRIFIVITMRTDFLGDCMRFLELPDAINRAQFLTPRLNRAEMSSAITGPAIFFGGDVASDVVAELVNAVQADRDELPILQHALARMWNIASRRSASETLLTLDDLNNIGGTSGALTRHAEELFLSLSARDKGRCEWLFRAVTEQRGADTGGQRVRRPRALARIAEWAEEEDWREFEAVVAVFGSDDAGFLTYKGQPGTPAEGAATIIDIMHEALIRRWGRLQAWTEAESRARRQFERLVERDRYVCDGHASLLEGADLTRALQWRKEGLLCELILPKVDALGMPRVPSSAWASRYGGPFSDVTDLIARSDATRRRKKVARWSMVGALPIVVAAIFWTQTRVRGGMADLEARELWSIARTTPREGRQERDDRVLSRIAIAGPEVRSRLLVRWFGDADSPASDSVTSYALLRAAVGIDEGIADQARNTLLSGNAAQKTAWLPLRVMAAPFLGIQVSTREVVTALVFMKSDAVKQGDGFTNSQKMEEVLSRLSGIVATAAPEAFPSTLSDVLQVLVAAEAANEDSTFDEIVDAWGKGMNARSAPLPNAVLREVNDILTKQGKDKPVVMQMGGAMAGAFARDNDIEERVVGECIGWAIRERNEGQIIVAVGQLKRPPDGQVLDNSVARRQRILMGLAQQILATDFKSDSKARRQKAVDRLKVLIPIAAALDGPSQQKLLGQTISLRKAWPDEEQAKTLDDYLSLMLFRIGRQASAELLAERERANKKSGQAIDIVSPWTEDEFRRDLRNVAGHFSDLTVERLVSRSAELTIEQLAALGSAFRAALLAATDSGSIASLRSGAERVLVAISADQRHALLAAMTELPAHTEPYSVARILSGLSARSFAMLSDRNRAAVIERTGAALDLAKETYEEAALAETVAAWPTESTRPLWERRSTKFQLFAAPSGKGDPQLRLSAQRKMFRVAGISAFTLPPVIAASKVEQYIHLLAAESDSDSDEAAAQVRELSLFVSRLSRASKTAVVDAFSQRVASANVRELRIWMDIAQPLLASIDMTPERARRWINYSRLPMANEELIVQSVLPLAGSLPSTFKRTRLAWATKQLGAQREGTLALNGLTESASHAGAGAGAGQIAVEKSAAAKEAGATALERRQKSIRSLEASRDKSQEELASDPFDTDKLHSLMVSFNKLSHALEDAGDDQRAFEATQNELAITRWSARALPTDKAKLRNLVVSLSDMSARLTTLDRFKEAEAVLQEYRKSASRLVEIAPRDSEPRDLQLTYFDRLSHLQFRQGDVPGKLATLQANLKAVRSLRDIPRIDSDVRFKWQIAEVRTLINFTDHQYSMGLLDPGLANAKRGVALATALISRQPESDDARAVARDAHYYMGLILERSGKWSEALHEYELAKAVQSTSEDNNFYSIRVASHAALTRAFLGQTEEAIRGFESTIQRSSQELDAKDTADNAVTLAYQHARLGDVYLHRARYEEAIAQLIKAEGLLDKVYRPSAIFATGSFYVGILCAISEAQLSRGDAATATAKLDKAKPIVDGLAKVVDVDWSTGIAKVRLTRLRAQTVAVSGNPAVAAGLLQTARTLAADAVRRWPRDALLRQEQQRIDAAWRQTQS